MDFNFISPDRPSKCTWEPNGTNSPHKPNCSKPADWRNVMPNILNAIGQTPMIKLNHMPKNHGIECEISKCEFLNPGGSVKDRIALSMVEDAERSGLLKPGYTIVEPTSGNTGVALAMVAAAKDYRCVLVIPEIFSDEKTNIARALGAKIVRTPGNAPWNGRDGPFAVSQRLQKQIPDSLILHQFSNPENPLVHYNRTASEVWEQCDGKIDYLVGGLGTGGSVTGIARRLRELSPSTRIVVADPQSDDQIHKVEGIGLPFVPTVTDLNVVDVRVKTEQKECFHLARELTKSEGLPCGGSGGAALAAALRVAKDLPADKRVVVILPDTYHNYTTKFASDSWMELNGFLDPPKPLKCNEWWWDLSVSEMPLSKPIVLKSDISCEEALKYMQEKGVRQVPIANSEGGIEGFVTLEKLLNCLISGETRHSDLAIKTLVRQFERITNSQTLGRLSRVLRHSSYALVVDQADAVVTILTQNDLYDFICRRK